MLAESRPTVAYLARGLALAYLLAIAVGPHRAAADTSPEVAKNDPFWTDPKDPRVVSDLKQGVFGQTVPNFWVFNPAVAQVQNEHVWSQGWMDEIQGGMMAQAAAEKAFKRG